VAAQSAQTSPYGVPINAANLSGTYPPGAYAAGSPTAGQPVTDPIVDESRKRHYASLFADNVALSYRKDVPTTSAPPANAAPAQSSASTNPDPLQGQDQLLELAGAQLAREEQLLQQMQQAASGLSANGTHNTAVAHGIESTNAVEKAAAKNPDVAEPGSFNSAGGKKYVLFEGTILESLLINRLDGSFAGPVAYVSSSSGSLLRPRSGRLPFRQQIRLTLSFSIR
jgi:hypothetical protein